MPNNKSDIISILFVELAEALTPLSYLNNQESVRYLFAQLGYDIPSNFNFDIDVSAFAALPPKTTLLIEAIENEDNDKIASLILDIVPILTTCFGLVAKIKTTLQSVPNFINNNDVLNNLPKRIIDFLIISHLGYKYKKIQSLLLGFGIIEKKRQSSDSAKFLLEVDLLTINWGKIAILFSDPEKLIKDTFGWGAPKDFIIKFVDKGYGQLLELLVEFFHSISMPAGIFHHHGDINLEFSHARNRELRVPLFRTGTWPEAYGEFGLIMRLYTGEKYSPVTIPSIDEGSDPISNDEQEIENDIFHDDVTLNEDNIIINDDTDDSYDVSSDNEDVEQIDYNYLASDLSPVPEKPSITVPKGIEVQVYAIGNIDIQKEIEFYLGADWKFKLGFSAGSSINEGINLILEPEKGFSTSVLDGNNNQISAKGEVMLTLSQEADQEQKFVFGRQNETSLSYNQIGVQSKLVTSIENPYTLDVKIFVKGGSFLLTSKNMDSFLAKILPESGIITNFEITIGWSSSSGVYFEGSGGLELFIPAHIEFGPVEIQGIAISLKIKDNKIPVEVSSTVKANLGPLKVVIENIGLSSKFSFPKDGNGNLGPINLSLGLKTPNGIALSISLEAIKGGGYLFFDNDRKEYAGAIELLINDWMALKAIGLVTTRMPDGSKGYSMIIVITAEFGTGIQLGLGFTLEAVGGLLGLNRTVNIQPVSDGVRTGAIQSVMFPQDVVANATKIISDLRTYFPPANDVFVAGLLAKISWGTPPLVKLSAGLILEFPALNITILGILKVALPDENKELLKLQVNFIGRIEPNNKLLWFYAELYDSKILMITLDGAMGLLINWGDNANFVVSVGGFNPRFNPPTLPFAIPRRISTSLLNSSHAKVRIEGYFAVTSNTVQFGAMAECYFGFSAFNVDGHISFDALFQFSPFYFVIDFSVHMSVKVFGFGLFSFAVEGMLEGPTPWHIKGNAKKKLTCIGPTIKIGIDETWGKKHNTELTAIEVFPLLKKEFENKRNWETILPKGSSVLVTLRNNDEKETLVIHPVGSLRISQRAIPINIKLDKVGNQKPVDCNHFSLTAKFEAENSDSFDEYPATKERFATSQFRNLEGSKRLSSPAFEWFDAGINIGAGLNRFKTSQATKRVIRYETIILDETIIPDNLSKKFKHIKKEFYTFPDVVGGAVAGLFSSIFGHFLNGNATTKSTLSARHKIRMQPNNNTIQNIHNKYSVVSKETNAPIENVAASFTSQTAAIDCMSKMINNNPELAGNIQVIPNTEVYAT
ncbi:MAG: hypothetical protein IH598_17665 [Bacteroidales bacterium]|nr:hypothetical protein [Bacteroidales bacterium]